MLTVRREQVERLGDELIRSCAAGLLPFIRAFCPMETRHLMDDALDACVVQALRTARRLGLRADRDLVVFAALSVRIGPTFYEDAVVRRILDDPGIAPEDRTLRMIREVPATEWARIRAAQSRGAGL